MTERAREGGVVRKSRVDRVQPFGVKSVLASAAASAVVWLAACASGPTASPAAKATAAPGAVAADPTALPANVVISTEPWTFETKDGKIISTLSYRILTTATKTSLTDRMPPFMEMALIHYTTA